MLTVTGVPLQAGYDLVGTGCDLWAMGKWPCTLCTTSIPSLICWDLTSTPQLPWNHSYQCHHPRSFFNFPPTGPVYLLETFWLSHCSFSPSLTDLPFSVCVLSVNASSDFRSWPFSVPLLNKGHHMWLSISISWGIWEHMHGQNPGDSTLGILVFLKVPQVILMCTKGWEPLSFS